MALFGRLLTVARFHLIDMAAGEIGIITDERGSIGDGDTVVFRTGASGRPDWELRDNRSPIVTFWSAFATMTRRRRWESHTPGC